jgi:hypothetical protein
MKKFNILSDSKSVIQALHSNLLKANSNCIIFKIKEKLIKLQDQGKSITTMWIPAHCNIEGNEKEYMYAKDAIRLEEEPQNRVPYTDFLPASKISMIEKRTALWETYWETSAQNRMTRGLPPESRYKQVHPQIPQNPLVPWLRETKKPRDFYSVITRLRTGHNRSPAHLNRLNIDPSACPCGKNIGTLQHMIFECPLGAHAIAQLTVSLSNIGLDPPAGENWSIISLLQKPNIEIYKVLYTYIKTTNMQI